MWCAYTTHFSAEAERGSVVRVHDTFFDGDGRGSVVCVHDTIHAFTFTPGAVTCDMFLSLFRRVERKEKKIF